MSDKPIDRLKNYIFLKMDIKLNNDLFFMLLTLVTIMIGAITNHLIEVIIYELIMLSAKCIRRGYYCRYYILYIIIHISLYLIGIITLDFFNFDSYVLMVIQVWGLIITCICCPIQDASEQLSQKKSKLYSVIYILVYLCVLNILYYFDNQYANMVLYMFVVINLIAVANEIENQLFKQLS